VRGRLLTLIAALLLFAAAPPGAEAAWNASWSAPVSGPGASFNNQTLRLVLSPHDTGSSIRIAFSNRFGTEPLTIGAASIAPADDLGRIAASKVLRFGGRTTVTIPAGSGATSDPISFSVSPFRTVAVDLYLPGRVTNSTTHLFADQTSFASPAGSGNFTRSTSVTPFTTTSGTWSFVTSLQVQSTDCGAGTVVALGDSITDGVRSSANLDRRWPDVLQRRLDAAGSSLTVANAGIAGNRVLTSAPLAGPPALSRLDADVFAQPRLRGVVLLEGINDLTAGRSATDLIGGLAQIRQRLINRGVPVLIGTIPPFTQDFDTYGAVESQRQQVNAWIRTLPHFIDFDAALRSNIDPRVIAPAYDSGDHLHPNDQGYTRLANTVPLTQIQGWQTCVP